MKERRRRISAGIRLVPCCTYLTLPWLLFLILFIVSQSRNERIHCCPSSPSVCCLPSDFLFFLFFSFLPPAFYPFVQTLCSNSVFKFVVFSFILMLSLSLSLSLSLLVAQRRKQPAPCGCSWRCSGLASASRRKPVSFRSQTNGLLTLCFSLDEPLQVTLTRDAGNLIVQVHSDGDLMVKV